MTFKREQSIFKIAIRLATEYEVATSRHSLKAACGFAPCFRYFEIDFNPLKMSIKILRILTTGLCSLLLNICFAQQTITITGNDIQDAILYRNLKPGYEYTYNTNYGNHPRIAAVAWSASGYNSYFRSFLSFNLLAIPSGSVIQSATLHFYSDPSVTGSSDANGNSQLSGSNAFYLEKVTSAWNEFTVTWNNQPGTTTTDRVWVGPSISTMENRQINLANIVQGWINNP